MRNISPFFVEMWYDKSRKNKSIKSLYLMYGE